MNHPSPPGILSEVLRRSRRLFWLKLPGISVFIWLFFEAYFFLLRNPAQPVLVMPQLAIDRWLPFQPSALWPYLSLWLYVGFAPGLMGGLRALLSYGIWVFALCLGGLACFYLLPTAAPLYTGPGTDSALYAVLRGLDAAGNACPSMHVAAACYSGVWLDRIWRAVGAPLAPRLVTALWGLLIVYSTLAVKQHVLLDVLAGGLWGVGWAWAAMRWSSAGWDTEPRHAVRPSSRRPRPGGFVAWMSSR
ncbi:phosphatase PAP2 family protein [Sphaerotilus microaerophilus]|uniref:Phosphatidic acid phosphatase type 2/haloperoxidase domain-containing protein n=1 Tax=Sphaerotilus microaerophilus TaxID=2914710 RepID=A0ABN6PU71_9BURK|nr:phosphatase PAP2 family protein [Sphaerotilus sp. FB-5]BDI07450.1 hypothetical protein CATMQ487_44200 [Sphaerotilus sp. FB-5]